MDKSKHILMYELLQHDLRFCKYDSSTIFWLVLDHLPDYNSHLLVRKKYLFEFKSLYIRVFMEYSVK